jgi:hypothetical protein
MNRSRRSEDRAIVIRLEIGSVDPPILPISIDNQSIPGAHLDGSCS